MRKIFRKLRSARGASLLIALLFFLVCLTAGSLILTAATASAVKAKDRDADEQSYLAAASAARLLKAEQGGCTYTAGRVRRPENPPAGAGGAEWQEIDPVVSPEGGDLLTDAYGSLAEGGTGSYRKQFSITADEKDVPAVAVDFQMEAGGDAVFTLTCGSSSMKVSFPARTATVTDNADPDGESYEYRTTSWSAGVITKGGTPDAED